jgi:hypothetical protein
MKTGKATAPSLGTAEGKKVFHDGIAKTKADATLALKKDVPSDQAKAWAAFVKQLKFEDWQAFTFMPTDANAAAEVDTVYQAFLHMQD